MPSRRPVMNLNLSSDTAMEDIYQEVQRIPASSDGTRHRFKIETLFTVKCLGQGNFFVDMMKDDRGNCYAVKKMRITTEAGRRKQLKRDLHFVVKAGRDFHPNIVRFYGYNTFRYEAWIVMEMMHSCFGKLLCYFVDGIPEDVVRITCSSTVTALNHLKVKHNMIHRDVRPSNILVSQDGTVKICDFGISRELVNSLASTNGAGNEFYFPPERLGSMDEGAQVRKYGIKSDVWSLGITLIELATGKNPYHDLSFFDAVRSIIHDAAPRLPGDGRFTHSFQLFVTHCLDKEISERPDYAMLKQYGFFTTDTVAGSHVVSSWLTLHAMWD